MWGAGADTPATWNAPVAFEPVPERIVEAVSREIRGAAWNRYPDRDAMRLREALAALHGVGQDQIFVANSAGEVLQSLYLAFAGPGRTVSVFEPSSVHEQLVRMSGASVRSVHWRSESGDGGTLTLNPRESGRMPDLVVVDRPNHYDGTAVSQEQVLALAEGMASGLVVINEERGEFLTQSASELVEDDRSLAVVRSFSRTLPLAGLGFGYLVGPRQLVAGLFSVVLPYHLDVIRQQVGLILLAELEEVGSRTEALIRERERISRALTDLGVQVLPSEADFVVFQSPTATAGLGRELAGLSVHIEVGSEPSQPCEWIMASVGSRSSNDALLRAVADVVAAENPIEA